MNKRIVYLAVLSTLFTPSSYVKAEDLSICKDGWSHVQNQDYVTAIELFEKCIKEGNLSQKSLVSTYRNMGIAYKNNKQYKEAVSYYNKAIKLNNTNPWVDYVNRGNAWDESGNNKKALADYSEALKLKPQYGEALYNRGIMYEKQNLNSDAKTDFIAAYRSGLRTPLLYDRLKVYGLLDENNKLILDNINPDVGTVSIIKGIPPIKTNTTEEAQRLEDLNNAFLEVILTQWEKAGVPYKKDKSNEHKPSNEARNIYNQYVVTGDVGILERYVYSK